MTGRKRQGSGSARRRASTSISQLIDDLPTIRVSGTFPDKVNGVSRTDTDLILGMGRGGADGETTVLVPYLDVSWIGAGIAEESVRQLHSQTLGLDNLAFVMMDMGRDLAAACDQLARIAGGGMGPDPARNKVSWMMLEEAASHLSRAASTLKLLDGEGKSAASKD